MLKKIYIIAGESSGDFIGYKLIESLKEKNSSLKFYGIGGPLMASIGFESLFDMSKIAIMGFLEVITKIFTIKKLINNTIDDIVKKNPNILITIDSLGFNKRIAKEIKKRKLKIKLVHYVAPTVWAWKPKRAEEISKIYDYLLCLFDFELPYFKKVGLKSFSVGHPIVESGANLGNKKDFIKKFNINNNNTTLLLIPGSRMSEVSRLLSIFADAVVLIKQQYPNLQVVLPTVPHLQEYITNYVKKHNLNYIIVTNTVDKYNSFNLAKVALAASGTVTLELSLCKIPTTVAQKVSFLNAFIARLFLKIKYFSIINIIANKEIIKEYIQEECTPENLAKNTLTLLNNKEYPERDKIIINNILHQLGYNNFIPSDRASNIILKILNKEI